ncbi:22566_t:CDS:2, partial [Gigaspora rosea]
KVYNETKKDVEMLNNNDNSPNLCLISDRWSNLVHEHWTNYILATPKPVFYAAYPTNEMQQNEVTIANNLEKIMIEIGISKISAIITDNASLMKKAWHLLELDYPEILFLGCIQKSSCIFSKNQSPMAVLKWHQLATYNQRISLKYPVKMRWGSSAACLNSLIRNQLALQLTITKLAYDNIPQLALFYQWYHEQLESNGMPTISKFIQQYDPDKANIIWQQLLQYKTKTGIFDFNLAWNAIDELDPVSWRKGNFEKSAPELCKDTLRILTIPSSSAASERNWSNFSYIHDKKRCQLTLQRVLKLVYIYTNYKLSCPKLKSSNMMEATVCFNSRPSESHKFELLDPNNGNKSSEDELAESSKGELAENNEEDEDELSESEIELLTESDIDSEDE